MDNNFNAVNDAQGEVVDTHSTATDFGEDVSGDTGEIATLRQSAEANAAFAQMRRSMEQATRERDVAIEELDRLREQNDGAVSTENERAESELSLLKAELDSYREREQERQFGADLEEIKRVFPDENAKNVEELGVDFIRMRAVGIDNLTAYRAIAQSRKKPAGIGRIGADALNEERLFSSDELDSLTKEQLDNPNILRLALKSMRNS